MIVTPGAYFAAAAGVLLLPMNWLTAAVTAAGFHELCHLAALRYLKIPIYQIKIGSFGAKIATAPMSAKMELLCAAAGPAGSFCLMLLFRWFPLLGILGMIQGLFNMLPIYPMDGGRIIRSIFVLAKNRH